VSHHADSTCSSEVVRTSGDGTCAEDRFAVRSRFAGCSDESTVHHVGAKHAGAVYRLAGGDCTEEPNAEGLSFFIIEEELPVSELASLGEERAGRGRYEVVYRTAVDGTPLFRADALVERERRTECSLRRVGGRLRCVSDVVYVEGRDPQGSYSPADRYGDDRCVTPLVPSDPCQAWTDATRVLLAVSRCEYQAFALGPLHEGSVYAWDGTSCQEMPPEQGLRSIGDPIDANEWPAFTERVE
jgi:hypothetical protein